MQEALLAQFMFWWVAALLSGKNGRVALIWSAPGGALIFWLIWLAAQHWSYGFDRALHVLCIFAATTAAGLLIGFYSRRGLLGLRAGVFTPGVAIAALQSGQPKEALAGYALSLTQVRSHPAQPVRGIWPAPILPQSQATPKPFVRIVEAIGESWAASYEICSKDPIPEQLKRLLEKIEEADRLAA